MAVKNVDARYPPTALVHGKNDTDVPYRQSVMMADEFSKHRVEHLLIGIDGAEHGLQGGDATKINNAYSEAFDFLKKHL